MVEIEYYKGDITALQIEAIVNAANPMLMGGSGVDGAIHRAAGPRLHEACMEIKGNPRCPTGEARLTDGFELPAQYIIHTVGPVYYGGQGDEEQLLYNAYYNSMQLAYDNGIREIAFPAISTGVFGYPPDKADIVAHRAVNDCLRQHPKHFRRIVFVQYG